MKKLLIVLVALLDAFVVKADKPVNTIISNIATLIDLSSLQTEFIRTEYVIPQGGTNDVEMIQMYQTSPGTFSEDELLYLASLSPNLQAAIDSYQTTLNYFPASETALINLSTLLLRQGSPEKVIKVLEENSNLPESALINLASAYAQTGQTDKAEQVLSPMTSQQARYNLGVIKAAKNESAEAMELFGNHADVNSAIAALSVNKNARAAQIMSMTSDQSPRAEYVRAIIAARAGDEKGFIRFMEAVNVDSELAKRALTEPEFNPFLHILKN